jgi:gentisate 1,2-dioxygenase
MRAPVRASTPEMMSVIAFLPRGRDYQTRQSQDKFCIVIKGSGTLMIAEPPHTFSEGDEHV